MILRARGRQRSRHKTPNIIVDAGYKRVTGEAAPEALKPFLGGWEYDRADSELKVDGAPSFTIKQSGNLAMSSAAGDKDTLSDVYMDRNGQIVLVAQDDATSTTRVKSSKLVVHTQYGDLVFTRRHG